MARRKRSQPPRNVKQARRLIDELLKQRYEFEHLLSDVTMRHATLATNLQSLKLQHDKLAERAFPLLARRSALKTEIESTRKNPTYRRMWTSWTGVPTAKGKQLLDQLNTQYAEVEELLARLTSSPGSKEKHTGHQFVLLGRDPRSVVTPLTHAVRECEKQLADAFRRINATRGALERNASEIEQACAHLAQLEAHQHRKDKDRAFLAQARGKSRDQAEAIKKQLTKTSNCPYCSLPLGDDPHADHIYPQSKGGLSTVKNMVYVCQLCNQMKSDLTLVSFIATFNLDRSRIESALRELGKDF